MQHGELKRDMAKTHINPLLKVALPIASSTCRRQPFILPCWRLPTQLASDTRSAHHPFPPVDATADSHRRLAATSAMRLLTALCDSFFNTCKPSCGQMRKLCQAAFLIDDPEITEVSCFS
jgi:hypothetical protein